MISPEEGRRVLRTGDRFVIQPDLGTWGYTAPSNGEAVSGGFFYRSDSNDEWYSREEISKILDAEI
jgi:hypothetical protein